MTAMVTQTSLEIKHLPKCGYFVIIAFCSFHTSLVKHATNGQVEAQLN